MSRQKKIMLLGGIHYLLPVIKAAHEQGYYVITADYLPDNVAHKYSDEYVNVSIVDKEAVLKVAQEKQIDGIISFGVDPGVVAAAYVQEKMELPSMGPYASVEILQNKDKFRVFLQAHGFNCPKSKGYSSVQEAMADTDWLMWPMIVKPTDSAGSKGVTRVDRIEDYKVAIEEAFAKSIKGNIIVEQYLEKVGCSSDTDSFLQNGKWRFMSFNAQRFDAEAVNPYAPSAYTWPSTFPEHEAYLSSELQRLMDLLHMQTSVFNIETRIATDGKAYIMEATPRGGGNRLCEMLRYATGVDMITAQVRAAVGDPVEKIEQKPYNGHWAEVILHAPKAGVFAGIEIADSHPAEVIERDLWVKEGDRVEAFHGANDAIGTLVLRFEDKDEMEYAITHQKEWLDIKVNSEKCMKSPIVSICCITYNHAPFIRKALDGFLMQEPPTGVSKDEPWYEILIHDDASTDGTTEIIKEYAAKYPDRIFPLYEEENQYKRVGTAGIDFFNYNRAKGRYIAYCEGDDYWTDAHKLQKQVDFMDAHPEYSICFHDYDNYDVRQQKLFPSSEKTWYNKSEGKSDQGTNLKTTDYFHQIGQPLTMLFRVSMFDFEAHNRYKYYRDTHEIYHLLKAGKGYWMNFVGGFYHLHNGGISTSAGLDQHCWEEREHVYELYMHNRDDKELRAYWIEILLWNHDVFKREGRVKEFNTTLKPYWKLTPSVMVELYWIIFKRAIRNAWKR